MNPHEPTSDPLDERGPAPVVVSVIIPSYNCAPWLARAVGSAFALGEAGVEVIVVDDGSTDDTPAVCAALLACHPSLRVVRQPNGGLSVARNAGLDAATGEFILFLDADDELLPFDLALVRAQDCDMLRMGFVEVSEDGQTTLREERSPPMPGMAYLHQRLITHSLTVTSWAYVYRRAFLDAHRLRFTPNLVHEDMLFAIQTLLAAGKVAALETPIYRYIRRTGSLTRTTSYAARARRVRSLMRIVDASVALANRHAQVDLWLWTTHAIDHAWILGVVGDSRRLAWSLLMAEVGFFLRYRHWGVYRRRRDALWRLRMSLTRFLWLRDPVSQA